MPEPEKDARHGRFGSPALALLLGAGPDAVRVPLLGAGPSAGPSAAPPLPPPDIVAPDLEALRRAAVRMTAAFSGADFGPLLRAAQGLARTFGAAEEALFSSPAARKAAYFQALIVADEGGRFRVGGWDDDIDWLREFWAFRHGEDHVSPVFGARHRRFLFRPERIERAARLRWLWAEAERHFDGAVL